MIYGPKDSLLRDRSGATKATCALLGAIVVVAGVGALGGAGARLGDRVAASDPAPDPSAFAAPAAPLAATVVEASPAPPAAVARKSSDATVAATDARSAGTRPAATAEIASSGPMNGSEARFAPARAARPAHVTAARTERLRLAAIRDAVSAALDRAARETAETPAVTAAAWIPASGTLDIRPRSRPAEN